MSLIIEEFSSADELVGCRLPLRHGYWWRIVRYDITYATMNVATLRYYEYGQR